MRTLTITISSLFFLGCNQQDDCYLNNYQSITNYSVNSNAATPDGIRVDTSGFDIDLDEIDRQTRNMEECIQNVFRDFSFIDEETAILQDCRDENFGLITEFNPNMMVRRDCLTVKIAPDWYNSTCSEYQIFPCDINPAVCEAKGIEVTEECPCRCRSIIQNENIIITTPNLYLYRGELARMVTGCNNPWFEPISACLLD